MTKTSVKIIFPLLALALFLPLSAKAFAVKTGNTVNIAKNEIVDGNLYAAGSTLVIDGQVKGDVVCAGQVVNITGQVDGDVLCAAQSINVTGAVAGSVRVAGSGININSKVGRNLMAFGSSVILGADSEVAMDALFGAAFADINGKVAGNLHGGGSMITLNGPVGKDVSLNISANEQAPELIITDKATIGGNLDYTSLTTATIAKKSNIAGKINYSLPKPKDNHFANSMLAGLATIWLWCEIIGLLGTLLIGLGLVLFFKDKILVLADDMVARPMTAIGRGALLLLLGPFALLFLVITIIGLPLAFVLGLLWILLMIFGKILVAILAGLLLMGRYRHKRAKNDPRKESTGNMILAMIVGVTVTFALFIIPVFGWVLGVIGKMWGMGALWLALKKNCCSK